MPLVLYRKYRPKNFSEVIGQENIVQTLKNAIALGMVSHAYLFSGPRGSGKTTLARILAKAVNCQKLKNKNEPCNSCSACQQINSGRALDLVEIDAASNRGIDEIRDLKDSTKFMPASLTKKVYIIDEAHQLTKEAANALLKLLEEPPEHTMFILATTEAHKMISTITSRCQHFIFRKLTVLEIVDRLKQIAKMEKIEIEPSALELIAYQSGGSVRDAESLLEQCVTFSSSLGKRKTEVQDIRDLLGLPEMQSVAKIVDFIIQKKTAEAISFLNETLETGRDPQEFIKAIIDYLRYGLLLKINPKEIDQHLVNVALTPEELAHLKSQIINLNEKTIRQMLDLFLQAENKAKFSPIPQLPIELALMEIISIIEK